MTLSLFLLRHSFLAPFAFMPLASFGRSCFLPCGLSPVLVAFCLLVLLYSMTFTCYARNTCLLVCVHLDGIHSLCGHRGGELRALAFVKWWHLLVLFTFTSSLNPSFCLTHVPRPLERRSGLMVLGTLVKPTPHLHYIVLMDRVLTGVA